MVVIASTMDAPQPFRPSEKDSLTGERSSWPKANFLRLVSEMHQEYIRNNLLVGAKAPVEDINDSGFVLGSTRRKDQDRSLNIGCERHS
jgi:hypothetical protein